MNWVIRVNQELMDGTDTYSVAKRWERRAIYSLPASITDVNRDAYTPRVVSFGPCHYGRKNLEPMEEHKQRALFHFLRRSDKSLEFYVDNLAKVVEDLKDAYDSLEDRWRHNTDEFLRFMIFDGCFMLEILRIFTQSTVGYDAYDPIFSNHGIVYVMPDIMRDMLIIDNQLPILVLHELIEAEGMGHTDLDMLLFRFFNLERGEIGECLHVLEFYHRTLFQQSPICWEWKRERTRLRGRFFDTVIPSEAEFIERAIPPEAEFLEKGIPSAAELRDAGIQIKKSSTRSLKDISFHEGSIRVILRLPVIVVDRITETLFLNLLAFERYHVGAGREVTNYLAFMNNIIRDSKDISLLRSCDIIQNSLGKDEFVADIFNSVTKDITIDPDSWVYQVHMEVIKYCIRPWVRWRANLVRTYFSSPWACISVIASILLFAFAFAQTGYTIFAYYHKP